MPERMVFANNRDTAETTTLKTNVGYSRRATAEAVQQQAGTTDETLLTVVVVAATFFLNGDTTAKAGTRSGIKGMLQDVGNQPSPEKRSRDERLTIDPAMILTDRARQRYSGTGLPMEIVDSMLDTESIHLMRGQRHRACGETGGTIVEVETDVRHIRANADVEIITALRVDQLDVLRRLACDRDLSEAGLPVFPINILVNIMRGLMHQGMTLVLAFMANAVPQKQIVNTKEIRSLTR